MQKKTRAVLVVFTAVVPLSGCAGNLGSMVSALERHETRIELSDVAFHPQVTDQCGPASLATILEQSGVGASPEELRSRIYIPGRQGSLQIELLAATRHYGRIPYVIDPDATAILAELEAGRPVLVLQNLGATLLPVWHYAVVVGYLPDERQFVLRSGDRERHLTGVKAFLRSWQRGEFWGFVALRPGELPANADANRYLRAVAALESVGDSHGALPAYRAATAAWPDNGLAWLGLGNTLYATRDLGPARDAYRQSLAAKPGDRSALNNLAQVQFELGCRDEAMATIQSALSVTETREPLYPELRRTLEEIEAGDTSAVCRQAVN